MLKGQPVTIKRWYSEINKLSRLFTCNQQQTLNALFNFSSVPFINFYTHTHTHTHTSVQSFPSQ